MTRPYEDLSTPLLKARLAHHRKIMRDSGHLYAQPAYVAGYRRAVRVGTLMVLALARRRPETADRPGQLFSET